MVSSFKRIRIFLSIYFNRETFVTFFVTLFRITFVFLFAKIREFIVNLDE